MKKILKVISFLLIFLNLAIFVQAAEIWKADINIAVIHREGIEYPKCVPLACSK